jgi:hypothetical protein
MAFNRQRGPRVIYVAASARQLPQPVQRWLGEEAGPAVACPNIYDALAMLATGKRPDTLIVTIEAVDWHEMDFFDHALRLSPDTMVYVTGPASQQAKLDAACSRGAHPFDPEAAEDELTDQPEPAVAPGPAGLLAGSLGSGGFVPLAAATEASPAGEPDSSPAARPAVRLVAPAEPDEPVEPPVPFPWSPAPNRPQRTPPPPVSRPGAASSPRRPPDPQQVKLTPEEVAALLKQPPPADGRVGQEMQP